MSLEADGLCVGGSVLLRNGFTARGQVCLSFANIGGTLECDGGIFEAPDDSAMGKDAYALCADGLKVNRGVLLRNDFVAHGEVRLLHAEIRDVLDCEGGTFHNPKGRAISAGHMTVHRTLFMRRGFSATGVVDLHDARLGSLNDDESSWPKQLLLGGCRYGGIASIAPRDAKRRLQWLARHDRTMEEYVKQHPEYSDYRFDPQPYHQLAHVLRQHGFDHDADVIMISAANKRWGDTTPEIFRRRKGKATWHEAKRQTSRAWTWLWFLIFWLFLGHGYRRWLPVAWLLAFVIAGWAFFGSNTHLIHPSEPAAVRALHNGEPWMAEYPPLCPFIYTLDTLIPLVNLHQEEFWIPRPWFVRCYLCVHIGMGWVLSTLIVVNLTGLVRQATTGAAPES